MNDLIWNVSEYTADIYQGFIMSFFIYRFLVPRTKRSAVALMPVCAALFSTAIIILNNISIYEGLASGLYILILFIYALFVFQDSLIKKILASIVAVAVLLLVTTVELNLISSIFRMNIADLIQTKGCLRFITLIVIQVSVTLSLHLILKLFRYSDDYSFTDWFPIIIVLFISFVLVSLLHFLSLSIQNDQRIYINLSDMILLILNFLTFYVIYSIFLKNKEIREMKIAKIREEHMEQFIKTSEAQYDSIRKLKHDIKDQLLSIYELIAHNEIEEAKSFISKTNKIIDTETYVKTNSTIANAIINSKLSTAATLGIKVSCITVSDFNGIDEVDLCELLGNILENAITACNEMPSDSSRFIYLEIGKENNIFTFLVKNSLQQSVIEKNPKLRTSKSDKENHGLGIAIIKDIVCKYNGRLDYYEIDNSFCCSVILET